MEANRPGGAAFEWVRLYPRNIGPGLEPETGDVLTLFEACVAERPAHCALRYFDRDFTYEQLDAASDALAVALGENGVGRGDRVVLALQNTPEFLIGALAAWKLAAIPLPVNPMYRRVELTKIFADAEPSAVIGEFADADELESGLNAAGVRPRLCIFTDPADFGLGFAAFERPQLREDPRPSLQDLLRAFAGRRPSRIPIDGDELGLILYTSGTTGMPKGAMIRHSSLVFNAQLLRDWCGLGAATRSWGLAPFFHITGLVCHIISTFSARATLVAHYRFDAHLALAEIRKTRPTFTIGAITAFNALMNTEGAVAEDFGSFERIYSGGAPIPPAVAEAFMAQFGQRVHPSYGMTETAAPTHLAPPGLEAPTDPASGTMSIGVPVPSTEAAVLDDQGRLAAIGEVGEIVVRGPQVMAGYWRKDEESAAALAQGWMHTGDVGFRDEAGWFYLVDRKKDVIIASGFKVWPREVEDVLYDFPAVREAAVVGVPDTYRGETVKAFISLRPEVVFSEADLIRHCRERLASYKAPRVVEVLPELPKTATGKIQRVALRERPPQ